MPNPFEDFVLLSVIQIQATSRLVASCTLVLDIDAFGQSIGLDYGVRRRVDLFKQAQVSVVLDFLREGLGKEKIKLKLKNPPKLHRTRNYNSHSSLGNC